jgi:hypothetical protein
VSGPVGRRARRPDGTYDETALSLVLNAVADVSGEGPAVIDDWTTEATVRRAFEAATTPAQRDAFASALAARSSVIDAGADADADSAMVTVARAVTAELDARDARLTVVHDAPVPLDDRAATLARFGWSRDPDALSALDVTDGVRTRIESAADRIEREAYGAASDVLVDAIADAEIHDDAVGVRTLAAWASHWAGDHEDAVDLVEEARHLDTRAWDARQVGVAAGHDSPEFFRDGRLASAVYLRARVDAPDGTDVGATLVPESADLPSQRFEPPLDCRPVEALPAAGRLRFRLRGEPTAMPSLETYYLALGVVEPRSARARTVERLLLDGPGPDARETVRIDAGGVSQ